LQLTKRRHTPFCGYIRYCLLFLASGWVAGGSQLSIMDFLPSFCLLLSCTWLSLSMAVPTRQTPGSSPCWFFHLNQPPDFIHHTRILSKSSFFSWAELGGRLSRIRCDRHVINAAPGATSRVAQEKKTGSTGRVRAGNAIHRGHFSRLPTPKASYAGSFGSQNSTIIWFFDDLRGSPITSR
jgi:hypothetical protein